MSDSRASTRASVSSSFTPEATPPHSPDLVPSPPPIKRVEFDADGDLLLRLGSETPDGIEYEHEFKVCSATLRRSSVVWKRMLFGPWMEAKPTGGKWTVSLPDDKPKPFEIILNIIHSRFQLVPRSPSRRLLYGILVITNKYDLVHFLQPWAKDWMQAAKSDSPNLRLSGPCSHMWLTYISWELGDEETFTKGVKKILLHTTVDEDGELTFYGIHFAEMECVGPPDLGDRILENRNLVMTAILRSVNSEIVRRLALNVTACHIQDALPSDQKACNNAILGCLWRQMIHYRGALPPTSATEVSESISSFLSSLDLVFSRLQSIDCVHSSACLPVNQAPNFAPDLEFETEWFTCIKDSHKEYMQAQRLKTGLSASGE
ncbi:hypothetical protein B0T22DRAFT_458280 [Podospora appendiculata]|uniref:BTB domain-containing protein n=1 Tax=Podospora appendiculata TaxID=314037 RepID=A0AAE0X8T9_9PEZI|nr:hypothetical protein B0T22DRAFT_458280 [Podospora appendiculata]